MLTVALFIMGLYAENFAFCGLVDLPKENDCSTLLSPTDAKNPIRVAENRTSDQKTENKKKLLAAWLEEKRATVPASLARFICPVEDNFKTRAQAQIPFSKQEEIANNFAWFIYLADTETLCDFLECHGHEIEDSAIIQKLFSIMRTTDPEEAFSLSIPVKRTILEWQLILKKMRQTFNQAQWFAGRASPKFRYSFSIPGENPTWYVILAAKKRLQDANGQGYFSIPTHWIEALNMISHEFFQELEKLTEETIQFIFHTYPDPELYMAEDILPDNSSTLLPAFPYHLEFTLHELQKQFPSALKLHNSWEEKLEHVIGRSQISLFWLDYKLVWYGVPPRYWLKKIAPPWCLGDKPQSYFDRMKTLRLRMMSTDRLVGGPSLRKRYREIARPFFLSCEQSLREHLLTDEGKKQLQEHNVTTEQVLEIMLAPIDPDEDDIQPTS